MFLCEGHDSRMAQNQYAEILGNFPTAFMFTVRQCLKYEFEFLLRSVWLLLLLALMFDDVVIGCCQTVGLGFWVFIVAVWILDFVSCGLLFSSCFVLLILGLFGACWNSP